MSGAVLDAMVAEPLAAVRSGADDDLRALGAAPAVLDGISSHFQQALRFLLGSHVRDQARIWEAMSGGWPRPDAVASDAFAAYMRADGWAALFERLPSLEALLSTVIELEAEAASLLLARAAADAGELAERFGVGGEAAPLARASIGLSDPHNGRRTVASLEFAGGMRVIYKPRPVAMERTLTVTLDRLRREAELDVPAGPDVLERDGYGWCEFVEHRSCASRAEVDRYFWRLGALAGVLAALAATDCHADNFIARGADPILVDAETLLHPRLLASPGFSVLETEIVPSQVRGPSGQLIDYAGFDAPASERDDPPNLPAWGGRSHRLGDHRAAFDQGVEAAREALGRAGPAPVRDLANRRARVVLRPTSVYAALLAHTISASALGSADGGRARVERELIRYQDPGLAPDVWDAVRRAELAALAQADVPYFLADTTTGDLHTLDGALLGARAVEPVLPELDVRIS